MVYGITYIDHRSKIVFNGSDLGKQYSAKGLLERTSGKKLDPVETIRDGMIFSNQPENGSPHKGYTHLPIVVQQAMHLLDELTRPILVEDELPYELTFKAELRKKRKRKLRL